MKISKHAKKRSQPRAISKNQIDLILEYGHPISKCGNAIEYRVLKRQKNRIISDLKHLMHIVEKLPKKAVLVSNDGQIITVYNLNRQYNRSICHD